MSEQQLWSDEQIIEMLKRAGLNTVPVKAAMCEMRDEYEQRIAALKTEVEWQEHLADESDSQVAGMEIFIGEAKDTWAKFYAQKARITELEAQLAQLRSGRWVPVRSGTYQDRNNGEIRIVAGSVQVHHLGHSASAWIPTGYAFCEWVEGEDMPADVRQNILDMCDDWKQSGYEDDELGFDYERAHVVMDWLQRRGGAA